MATENTGRLLRQAGNQLVSQFNRFAAQYDLTSMQMAIIDFLSRRGDTQMIQHNIEVEFNVQRPTMSTILQRMEKKNLIHRKINPRDSRQKLVVLTKKARELEHDIKTYMDQQNTQLETVFGEKRVTDFQEILKYYINLTNEAFDDGK